MFTVKRIQNQVPRKTIRVFHQFEVTSAMNRLRIGECAWLAHPIVGKRIVFLMTMTSRSSPLSRTYLLAKQVRKKTPRFPRIWRSHFRYENPLDWACAWIGYLTVRELFSLWQWQSRSSLLSRTSLLTKQVSCIWYTQVILQAAITNHVSLERRNVINSMPSQIYNT